MVGFSNSEMAGIMDSINARLGSGGSDGSELTIVLNSPGVGKMSASGVISMPVGL
jgi:hypothetical protein